MGREVRRVPKDWCHPTQRNGRFQPRFDEDFDTAAGRWKTDFLAWERRDAAYFEFEDAGCFSDFGEYWEYVGEPPKRDFYRPKWANADRTHFQLYENVSEGTPISPVMESPEALARWLADNHADAGGGETATYEQWLRVCKGEPAPTFAMVSGAVIGGVAASANYTRRSSA